MGCGQQYGAVGLSVLLGGGLSIPGCSSPGQPHGHDPTSLWKGTHAGCTWLGPMAAWLWVKEPCSGGAGLINVKICCRRLLT